MNIKDRKEIYDDEIIFFQFNSGSLMIMTVKGAMIFLFVILIHSIGGRHLLIETKDVEDSESNAKDYQLDDVRGPRFPIKGSGWLTPAMPSHDQDPWDHDQGFPNIGWGTPGPRL